MQVTEGHEQFTLVTNRQEVRLTRLGPPPRPPAPPRPPSVVRVCRPISVRVRNALSARAARGGAQAGPGDEGVTARLLAVCDSDPDPSVREAARRALGI